MRHETFGFLEKVAKKKEKKRVSQKLMKGVKSSETFSFTLERLQTEY
jgi:hypothetical protein